MTLREIGYMVLEAIRENNIVDDERLDLRLVYDWIDLKRAQYIKNQRTKNPNNRVNLNLYQTVTLEVDVIPLTDVGTYPYTTAKNDYIVESTTTIPSILEDKGGPVVLTIETEDKMMLPFSFVDYDYMRLAGNGKFNSNLIFASIRDNKVYFKYNSHFDTYQTVVLRAIFEKPREVSGFSELTSRYPANLGLIEYIKNGVFDSDVKMMFSGRSDEVNDADGVIR